MRGKLRALLERKRLTVMPGGFSPLYARLAGERAFHCRGMHPLRFTPRAAGMGFLAPNLIPPNLISCMNGLRQPGRSTRH